MTAAPMSEYSMMKGKRYGAESCTIVPIMLILPQLSGSMALTVVFVVLVKLEAVHDCLNISSRNSLPFIVLLDSSATKGKEDVEEVTNKAWVSNGKRTVSDVILKAMEMFIIEGSKRGCGDSGEHLPHIRNSPGS